MSPERWQQIRAVFDAAVEQPVAGADAFLRKACGEDAELYAEVHRMLQEYRRPGLLDEAALAAVPALAGSPPVFQDGQVVAGRYKIERYISRGGMGEVYQAQDLELGGKVALKTLLPEIASDAAMIARFKQEIALSRKVAHGNVCKVYDLARHEGDGGRVVMLLSMEFLSGETLAERLHHGSMSTGEAFRILQQIGEALDAAHGAGVIHRDLKPSNVMLEKSGERIRAVVTDFGLARSFVASGGTTGSVSNKLVGTLDYMAPELLTGSVASFSSDVYALGMIAYKMVTGALPFAADTPLAGAILRTRQAVPSPRSLVPGIDEKWERAILRALDGNPARRFPQARHFVDALRGDTSMTLTLPVLTRRRMLALGAACLLAVSGFAGWRIWLNASRRIPAEAVSLYRKGVDDVHAGAYFAATKALARAAEITPRFSVAHSRLAEAWVDLEMPERASQEMLLAMRQDRADLSRFDQLEIDAAYLTVTRDFKAAAQKREQIVSIAGAEMEPGLNVDLGRAYEKSGQPDKALAAYRQAANRPANNAAAWLRIGVLAGRSWRNPQSVAQSEDAFRQAEELYQETSNLEGLTEVAFQRGIAENRRGQLEQGAADLRRAIEIAHGAGNIQKEVSAKLQLANNAYLAGDGGKAEQYARDALDTARLNQIESQAIVGIVNLGHAFRLKRDYAGAERYYQDALTLARRSASNRLVALCLYSLAAMHSETRQADQSAREAAEALAFFQPNHWVQETFDCLTMMGRANRDKGDYEAALRSFEQLLNAAEKSQDKAQIASAHESLGQVLFLQENYPQALMHYRKSLELNVDPGRAGYAALHCANALWLMGKYGEARKLFDQAESSAARSPVLQISVNASRADMTLSERNFAAAASQFRKLLAQENVKDASTLAELQAGLGLAYIESGNRAAGLRNCEDAVADAQRAQEVAGLFNARVSLLQGLLETGNRDRATSLFRELEPALKSYPAWRWRVLALMSAIDRQAAEQVPEALHELQALWGDEAFQSYLTRPDVLLLARPVLPSVSAKR